MQTRATESESGEVQLLTDNSVQIPHPALRRIPSVWSVKYVIAPNQHTTEGSPSRGGSKDRVNIALAFQDAAVSAERDRVLLSRFEDLHRIDELFSARASGHRAQRLSLQRRPERSSL
jgi:hypothetical protein